MNSETQKWTSTRYPNYTLPTTVGQYPWGPSEPNSNGNSIYAYRYMNYTLRVGSSSSFSSGKAICMSIDETD